MRHPRDGRSILVGLLVTAWGLSACTVAPRAVQHPSLRGAPASDEDSDASRLGAVTRAAAADLGCPRVEVILTFNRDYANVAQPRYVIDGCGKRAVYAEACEEYPRCRYVAISISPVPGSSVTAAGP